MYFGGSIALIAVGAILSFAVRDNINEVDLVVVGYILMAAGAIGIVLSFIANGQRNAALRRRDDLPPR
jgi:dolichol kinase